MANDICREPPKHVTILREKRRVDFGQRQRRKMEVDFSRKGRGKIDGERDGDNCAGPRRKNKMENGGPRATREGEGEVDFGWRGRGRHVRQVEWMVIESFVQRLLMEGRLLWKKRRLSVGKGRGDGKWWPRWSWSRRGRESQSSPPKEGEENEGKIDGGGGAWGKKGLGMLGRLVALVRHMEGFF